jgi:hypothetical protein
MSKNGFFSEYPYSQDIAIAPEMEAALQGRQHINASVSNSRYDDQKRIIADCIYESVTYIVRSESFLDQPYWLLISHLWLLRKSLMDGVRSIAHEPGSY